MNGTLAHCKCLLLGEHENLTLNGKIVILFHNWTKCFILFYRINDSLLFFLKGSADINIDMHYFNALLYLFFKIEY